MNPSLHILTIADYMSHKNPDGSIITHKLFFCSLNLHVFDPKYSKAFVKYFYFFKYADFYVNMC